MASSHLDRLLVAGLGSSLCDSLRARLADRLDLVVAADITAALTLYRSAHTAAVVLGSDACGEQAALDIAARIRRIDPKAIVILVPARGSEAIAVAALRAGVTDYFTQPITADELGDSIGRYLDTSPPAEAHVERTRERAASLGVSYPELVGESPVTSRLRDQIKRIAPHASTVMITGETGTGKELVARMLHVHGTRRNGPFVPVNCAAIPDTLLESELFGHERGAFTGALGARDGYLQQANGGTIFLDEIGDMNAQAQAKVLRAVEYREVIRVGARRATPVDVRVVAATNHDLDRAMAEGTFRKDLYFRLNVARIHLPPLRSRREDIPELLDYYVTLSRKQFERDVRGFTPHALQQLVAYEWPGNVRELKNVIEAVFLNRPQQLIAIDDLPQQLRRSPDHVAEMDERDLLVNALFATNWNKAKAARRLHWSRMTLYRKLLKYHLLKPSDLPDQDV